MKRFIYLTFCATWLLVFSACSQDSAIVEKSDMASLSFGAVLNDLMNKQGIKQQMADFPECSDASPSYVEVVLGGTTTVGSMEDPLIVEVHSTPGDFDQDGEDEYFTEESSSLQLEPGPYTLEFFAVFDAGDNLLWLAPMTGGGFDWLNTLPMEFNLGAGAKKYLDVPVVCYDDRIVNEYGYNFFDLETVEAIEFCMTGNFCDDNGRHSPADYSVSIWWGTDDSGTLLHDDLSNVTGVNDDGDPYSEPLCLLLPDADGVDNYYFEITMDGDVIRSGITTDADIRDLFDGEESVDYFHFRIGNCNLGDIPDLFGMEDLPM